MTARIVRLPGSSRKVEQVTGEFDRERGRFTRNRTETRFGLFGTDLGSAFEHGDRAYFLFGDSIPSGPNTPDRPPAGDAIAFTDVTDPERGLDLQFVLAPDEKYLSPRVPGVSLGSFEVPVGGFSAGGVMYVFFATNSTGGQIMGRSVLARSTDGGGSFRYLYDVSRERFINIAPAVIDNAAVPGLPRRTGQGVLLWASGPYRRSDPYLAWAPATAIERRSSWRYFAGLDHATGQPRWSTSEAGAAALFAHPCIGELSVAWLPSLRRWLMLYGCDNPRGILFRVAERPWGPWSPAEVLFDPWTDGGYCHFIHTSWDVETCDAVHDPGREREWGGEYAPYLIARFTRSDTARATIYWLMSTWNPYNTVLMRSVLAAQPAEPPTTVTGNPSLIQRRPGPGGDFEAVAPVAGGGLAHYRRDNATAGFPWHGPLLFGVAVGRFEAATLIQSNFGANGNLEVVARRESGLFHCWRDVAGWHGPAPLVADGLPVEDAAGNPALIQGSYGARGNFELVVPRVAGGLAHYWRDNDALDLPWHGPEVFAAGPIDAVTLIQSRFGSPGNLEVVARSGDRLLFAWRDGSGWHGPYPLEVDGVPVTGVAGVPALIQGSFGTAGNFELVTPRAAGGIAHYWRENDVAGLPWRGPVIVDPATPVAAVSLIQSDYGTPGNLELLTQTAGRLAFAWRDSATLRWHGLFDLGLA